jgi:hypothetical protein
MNSTFVRTVVRCVGIIFIVFGTYVLFLVFRDYQLGRNPQIKTLLINPLIILVGIGTALLKRPFVVLVLLFFAFFQVILMNLVSLGQLVCKAQKEKESIR